MLNDHNVKVIYPQSFPNRIGKNFINMNKRKDQIHKFDEKMKAPEQFEGFNSFYST
jgi:hypothetical protein